MGTLDSRMIQAPVVQYYFVDKDTGLPLTNGIVTFYQDNARNVKKAVYELTGDPTDYTYLPLPNPILLSAVGTPTDADGNDVVFYYFPYDGTPDNSMGTIELYYVTVESNGEIFQFDRVGVPGIIAGSAENSEVENYIENGQFLVHNNILPTDTTLLGQITQAVTDIAAPHWTFERPEGSSAQDFITFESFGGAVTVPSGSPKFFLHARCTSGSAGDAFKDIGYKFPDVNKFASTSQTYTFFFSAKSNSSAFNVEIILYKFYGTGGSAPTETSLGSFTIPTAWSADSIYTSFTFGENISKTISDVGDDYVQILIRVPPTVVYDMSLDNVGLIADTVVTPIFPPQTDGQFITGATSGGLPTPDPNGMDNGLSVVYTPTGFIFDDSVVGHISASMCNPAGYGLLNCDGAQYEVNAFSSDNIPYKRLWQKCIWDPTLLRPNTGTGLNFVTFYSRSDFTNIATLTTNQLGNVANTADGTPATGFTFTTVFNGDAGFGITTHYGTTIYLQDQTAGVPFGAVSAGTSGFVFKIETSSPFTQTVAYYQPTAASGLAGKYFYFSTTTTTYYVWFTVDGTGSDPAPGGTGILVPLIGTMNGEDVGNAIVDRVAGCQDTSIVFLAGSVIPAGSYFTFNTITDAYYVWYRVDNTGTDPAAPGRKGIEVDILSTDTAAQVLSKTFIAVNGKYFTVPSLNGMFLRGWDNASGVDPDAAFRWSNTPHYSGDKIGTYQFSQFADHNHPGSLLEAATEPGTPNTYVDIAGNTEGDQALLKIAYQGGTESRAINMSVNWVIKY